jgi:hypothetical protein
MGLRIVHPVDKGVALNPVDQWDCPPDAFLYRVNGPGLPGDGCGLLVRSMAVIEVAPALREFRGKLWLDVAKTFVERKYRITLLKENPRNFTNPAYDRATDSISQPVNQHAASAQR